MDLQKLCRDIAFAATAREDTMARIGSINAEEQARKRQRLLELEAEIMEGVRALVAVLAEEYEISQPVRTIRRRLEHALSEYDKTRVTA